MPTNGVMHNGSKNSNHPYITNGRPLQVVKEESGLDFITSTDMKPAKPILFSGLWGEILWQNAEVMLKLYNSVIRPHLEYAAQFWSPNYRKDIEESEKVRGRAMQMSPALTTQPQRNDSISSTSIRWKETQRGDMVQVFKDPKKFSWFLSNTAI